ncbi:MAG: peptidyl-prolyl cis-trans isomerase [Candidatus Latescibacteria bacterium]|nr:peptidyl-prolyl cis-trans isomerase [Candidatus Latescibacterota bacterium]
MYRRTIPIILSILTLTFSGCSRTDDPVVVKIGGKKITVRALKEFVAKLPASQQATRGDMDQLRSNLQILMDRELMMLEARNRGLDTTRVVTEPLKEARQALVMRALYEREISGKPTFREEEIRAYFERENLGEELRISRIVVATREEARAIYEQLKQGADFAELARSKSSDKKHAQQGGDVGWWAKEDLPNPIRSDVLPLKTGEIGEPMEWGTQFLVHTLTDRRSGAFEEWKEEIVRGMRVEWEQKRWDEYEEDVKTRYRMTLEDAALSALLTWAKTSGPSVQSPPDLSDRTLAKFKGGAVSVSDYLTGTHIRALASTWADSVKTRSMLEQMVTQNELMMREIHQKKIDRDPSILADLENRKEERMAEELRRVEVLEKVEASEEEARRFYEEHPSLYFMPAKATGIEVMLETKVEAERILKLAREGTDLSALAEEFSVRDRDHLGRKGPFRFFPYQKELYGGDLVEKAFEVEIGALTGPVKSTKDGYSVFKVLRKEAATYEPFEEAKQRAMSAVRHQKGEGLFREFMRTLKEQYADQIVVDEEQLVRVAEELPEPDPGSSKEPIPD